MQLFDGVAAAARRELEVAASVAELAQRGRRLKIAAVLFTEDAGSRLYSRLKQEAAERVGIEYQLIELSLTTPPEMVLEQLFQLNADPAITGIIIQKPWRRTWVAHQPAFSEATQLNGTAASQFSSWWHQLTSHLDLAKDVDGLHPQTLEAVRLGTWQQQGRVLPATAQAVLTILDQTVPQLSHPPTQVAVIGRSDIVGLPVAYALKHLRPEWSLTQFGRAELAEQLRLHTNLHTFEVVISATGQKNLLQGEWLRPGSLVIDVGEPAPDIDWFSLRLLSPNSQPAIITPVPGGVGPLTVAELMGNGVRLMAWD